MIASGDAVLWSSPQAFNVKNNSMGWGGVQWVTCLPQKHERLDLDSQDSCKSWVWQHEFIIPVLGGAAEAGGSWSLPGSRFQSSHKNEIQIW